MSHSIVKCSKCPAVILQCRCPGPHHTEYRVCDDCKGKESRPMPPVRGPLIVCLLAFLVMLLGCSDVEQVPPVTVDATESSTQVAVWLRAFTPAGVEVSACDLRLEVEGLAELVAPATCYEVGGADWGGHGVLGTVVYGFRIGNDMVESNPLHFTAIDDDGHPVGPPTTWILEQSELGTIDGAWRFASVVRDMPPAGGCDVRK